MGKSGAFIKGGLMRAGYVPLAWLALSAGIAYGQAAAQGQPAAPKAAPENPLEHLANSYCEKCHNTTDWSGNLAMDSMDLTRVGDDPETWEKAVNKLRGRLMPPAGQKQPTQAEVDATLDFLKTSLDASAKDRGVGHVPLERLSRTEFAASIKGLLGVEVDPKQVLPTENEVDGLSNIAGALSISPTFMQQYLSAVRHVAQRAVGEPLPKMATVFYGGGGGGGGQAGLGSPKQYVHKDGYPLGTRGGVSFTHVFPADGEYHFNFMDGDSIDAGLYPNGMETEATVIFLVDD